jgi:hypothetical protein
MACKRDFRILFMTATIIVNRAPDEPFSHVPRSKWKITLTSAALSDEIR